MRYVLICDDCGEEVKHVSTEPYVPNPIFETALGPRAYGTSKPCTAKVV